MLKCKNCGADVRFDPKTQKYVCDFCDSVWDHSELTDEQKSSDIKAEEQKGFEDKDDDFIEVITYTCPQCGGELFTTSETAATFCSFCGSSVLLERRVSKEMKPKYIIPFKVPKEEAAEIYKKKVKGAIFAPSYMKNMDIEKVRGIYMPYWTYKAFGNAFVSISKTESQPAVGGTRVNEYKIKADILMKGNGIEYDSASSFPDDLSQAIAPYDFKQARPFEASFMSGFYADAGDVEAETYFNEVSDVMKDLASEKAAAEMGGSKGSIRSQIPDLIVDGERAMYPVWFISARNKGSNKVSYAVVNGQSGKIAADIPVDNKKLLIGMLAIALPVFALLYLLITPTPVVATGVFFVLSIIGGIMAIVNMKKVKAATKNYYAWPIVLCILSVVSCIGVLLWNPVRDIYYYIAMVISGVLLGIGYWIMFNLHNKATLRKLPQLGKRGGNE